LLNPTPLTRKKKSWVRRWAKVHQQDIFKANRQSDTFLEKFRMYGVKYSSY
jgi:hypothetical protein